MSRKKGLIRRAVGAVAALLLGVAGAKPQGTIYTLPYPAACTGGDTSSTATGSFQKLWDGANNTVAPTVGTPGARHGCSVQNNGTHNMFITDSVGVAASTTGAAWVLAPGLLFNCNFSQIVLIGEIDLEGTVGDTFKACQF